MIKNLFITEITSNRILLSLSLAINLLLFLWLAIRGEDLVSFIGASTLAFYVLITVYGVKTGEEKRYRLYAQLPVTKAQISIATWVFVAFLLSVHFVFWMTYWLLAVGQSDTSNFYVLAGPFLAVLCLIAVISIGIDLAAYKPRYVQWIYIVGVLAILIMISNLDELTGNVARSDNRLDFLPVLSWELTGMNCLIALALCLFLIVVDYYVYTRSDSYLS